MRRHGLLREKAPAPAAHSIRRPPEAGRGLFAPTLKGRWVDHMLFKASENSLRDCRAGYSRWAGAVARLRVVSSSRAVRAGLAVANAVADLETPQGQALAARVGIATGLVVIGDLFDEARAREGAAVGATLALAARLQTLAEPGSVVIAPSTRRLIGGLFALADLGSHPVKGFEKAVRAWRVLRDSPVESRFEAFHGKSLIPLVGREHELGLLLERFERTKDGEGQVVLLSGEPGIGKSRMVRALRERLDSEPCTPISHFCSPFHANSALYPIIGLLERAARFGRDDVPETKLDKLEALLTQAVKNVDEVAPLMAALLSLSTGERYPRST